MKPYGRPDLCVVPTCEEVGDDEYHFYEDIKPLGHPVSTHKIVWNLCSSHCDFAMTVVESISQLDNPRERETW